MIQHLNDDEWDEMVEKACLRRLGVSKSEVIRAFRAGEIDYDRPSRANSVLMIIREIRP